MLRSIRGRVGLIGARIGAEFLGLSIGKKVLGLLAVPMAILLLASAVFVGGSANQAGRAEQVRRLTTISTQLVSFVGSVQAERSATLTYLSHPVSEPGVSLRGSRTTVDRQLAALRTALAVRTFANLSPALGEASASAAAGHARLGTLRADIDAGRATLRQTELRYGRVIAQDLVVPDMLADAVTDTQLARALRAYGAVAHLQEAAAQEGDVIRVSAVAGRFSPEQYFVLVSSVARQADLTEVLTHVVTADQLRESKAALASADSEVFLRYRAAALGSGSNRRVSIDATPFSAASATRLRVLATLGRSYATTVIHKADSVGRAARTRALLAAGLALIAIAGVLLPGLVLWRQVVRPLRRRSGSAEQVGVAAMFADVARRDQALLDRQLALVDELESRAVDPRVLQNLYCLDQLGAQLRRNADRLLVLGGIDTNRDLSAPMVLSDVLRTTIGEIESFHRIDLALAADPAVSGPLALPLAHLVAELMTNATECSGDRTRVLVTATFSSEGLVLAIEDMGPGMTAEELAEVNHRLASPSTTDIAEAQGLGFQVAARIAQRLRATIELRPRAEGGTTATVVLPPSVFLVDSLPATVRPAAPEPAAAPPDEPAVAAVAAPRRWRRARRGAPEPASVAGLPTDAASSVPNVVAATEPATQPQSQPLGVVRDILPGRPLRRAAGAGSLPVPAPRVAATLPTPEPDRREPAFELPDDSLEPLDPSAVAVVTPSGAMASDRQEARSEDSLRTAMAELSTLSGWTQGGSAPTTAPATPR